MNKTGDDDAVVVVNEDGGDDDDDSDDEETMYDRYFESMRSSTGLEIGVRVMWEDLIREATSTSCPPSRRTGGSSGDGSSNGVWEFSTCMSEGEIAPMFHGTQWAGTRVWNASVVALLYLIYQHHRQQEQPKQQEQPQHTSHDEYVTAINMYKETTVLELGCGLGVPGMVLHEVTGCNVVLTDRDALVEQLRRNISRTAFNNSECNDDNFREDENDKDNDNQNDDRGENNNDNIVALPLDWSEQGVRDLLLFLENNWRRNPRDGGEGGGKTDPPVLIDVAINCDCIYEPLYGDSWKQLIACQEAILRHNPMCVVLTCIERRKADGADQYLDEIANSLHVDKVQRIDPLPFRHPPSIELYRIYGRI